MQPTDLATLPGVSPDKSSTIPDPLPMGPETNQRRIDPATDHAEAGAPATEASDIAATVEAGDRAIQRNAAPYATAATR